MTQSDYNLNKKGAKHAAIRFMISSLTEEKNTKRNKISTTNLEKIKENSFSYECGTLVKRNYCAEISSFLGSGPEGDEVL